MVPSLKISPHLLRLLGGSVGQEYAANGKTVDEGDSEGGGEGDASAVGTGRANLRKWHEVSDGRSRGSDSDEASVLGDMPHAEDDGSATNSSNSAVDVPRVKPLYGFEVRLVPGMSDDDLHVSSEDLLSELSVALGRSSRSRRTQQNPCSPRMLRDHLYSRHSPTIEVYMCAQVRTKTVRQGNKGWIRRLLRRLCYIWEILVTPSRTGPT